MEIEGEDFVLQSPHYFVCKETSFLRVQGEADD